MTALAWAALPAGVAIMVLAQALGRRSRRAFLIEALELDPQSGHQEEEAESVVAERAVGLAAQVVARFDAGDALQKLLQQARIPLRAGEFLIVTVACGLCFAALLFALTGQWVVGVVGVALGSAASVMFVRRKVKKRRKAFERQLPGALSLVASSLSAGHTFLRAIQMMCEESDPPLAEEFAQVVSQTRLGDPVVDAMGRMAERLQVRDLDWVVQAIRIQQTVGGRLAELLHTLADFIRARDEVRREVLVLTAEGRMSAWVVGALPGVILLAVQVMNPSYMKPMFTPAGYMALGACAVSVGIGILLIRRMSNIEI